MTRRLVLAALPAAFLLAAAFGAPAQAMVLNPPDACAASGCEPGDALCVEERCLGVAIDCDPGCQEVGALLQAVCAQAPTVCEALFLLAGMDVGLCTFGYCDGDTVCVTVDVERCASPRLPAACLGSMCGSATACVWTDATPQGVCGVDACGLLDICPVFPAVCLTHPCDLVHQVTHLAGLCVGNPQAYQAGAPRCDGGLACVDPPGNKISTLCLEFA